MRATCLGLRLSLSTGRPPTATLHQEDGPAERTVGFLVDDLATAVDELHAAGVETDGIMENDHYRYTHFRAPDGRLYELVEEIAESES